MLYVLYILFFLSCVILVGSVLLQPGKTDAGALFTSNISNASFGPRGTTSVLSKITIVSAGCFMVLALLISMPALQGGVSVLQTTSAETPAEAPTNTNANTANANVATPDANANTGAGSANAAPQADTNAAPADNPGPAANEQPAANK